MPKHCWTLAVGWFWICAGCLSLAAASSPQFTYAQWRSDTISPQNAVITAVITIIQTRDGYLWLGTPDGLLRFDGVRFTTFNEGNTPGLKSGSVVKLFEDSRTNLWIGTDTGEVLLVKDGKVQEVRVSRGTRERRVASICEDASGAVWLYTADGYLAQYLDGKIGMVRTVVPLFIDSWQVTANYRGNRRSMIVDTTGTLWIGTDFVLHRLRPNPKSAVGDVPTIAPTSVGGSDFLLAGRQGGFWRFADGRIQKWRDDHIVEGCDWAYPWNVTNTPVRTACEDQQGNLVVGTGGEGIFWFDPQGQPVQLTTRTGLSSDTVLSLCVDRQGDLWVGTDGQGLNRVRRKVFEVLEESRGLTVQSVCNDGHDGLWIGYFGEHIDHWADGKLEQFRSAQGLRNLGVKSVFLDQDRQLWVGTQLRGLLWYQDGTFQKAPGSDLLETKYEISALYQDPDKTLWAGTQSGLAQWNGQQWKSVPDGLSGHVVRAILRDRSGNLWVGTQDDGVKEIRDGKTLSYGKPNGLPSENVLCLYQDTAGVLWAGTSVGLARLNGNSWVSYMNHFSGLEGNVSYVVDDDQGSLWMGSNVGLMRARKSDLDDFVTGKIDSVQVRSFGQSDGLPTRVCSQGSQPALCRTSDGKFWFPTIGGLVSVDPGQLKPNPNPPPVIIESIKVDNESQGLDSLRAPVPRAVAIPAAKHTLDIYFTSINLPAPDLSLFKYRLTGHEDRWTPLESQQRYAHFTKLPHGHYTFEVKACNEDGLWNETPATLAVIVLPPFWQTWWFISIASICILGLIVGSVHYVSTQKLQRQLAALREQEMLEKERARIARDLHDQLGANLTQVALLGEMAETDKDLPDEVEAHAKQISQTARETTRALDEIVWTVNPSNDTLDGLINYVCKYAQEYLALAGLRYRLEVPAQLPPVPIAPELRHNVFLAAKEAVNNVVKHSGATSAWLRLRLESNRFTLEVEDNGKGIPEGAEKKGRNGLRNMRKRLEEIGGEFSVALGQEGGTKVSLIVPLREMGLENPKSEGRNPKEGRSPKAEGTTTNGH
jgi:signal transduction histidine kinase/ligand-binding sensor domain-containing protein